MYNYFPSFSFKNTIEIFNVFLLLYIIYDNIKVKVKSGINYKLGVDIIILYLCMYVDRLIITDTP